MPGGIPAISGGSAAPFEQHRRDEAEAVDDGRPVARPERDLPEVDELRRLAISVTVTIGLRVVGLSSCNGIMRGSGSRGSGSDARARSRRRTLAHRLMW